MVEYVKVSGELPRESQLRAVAVLNVLGNQGPGGELLAGALAEMTRRWDVLEKLFESSACYAMQVRP